MPEVGRALNAEYVVEGGVRRAGDRVRITAQLINAATGAHLTAGYIFLMLREFERS